MLVWFRLKKMYEPDIPSRHFGTLQQILHPNFGSEFDKGLLEWEADIDRYELQSLEIIPDSIKRSVLMTQAPAEIRVHLQMQTRTLTTYAAMRDALNSYCLAKRPWSGEVSKKQHGKGDAMEVDGLWNAKKGGKSKGKGKGHEKGKGEEKGKSKGKGKGKDGKNNIGGTTRFDGYCSFCEKYGHKRPTVGTTLIARLQTVAVTVDTPAKEGLQLWSLKKDRLWWPQYRRTLQRNRRDGS